MPDVQSSTLRIYCLCGQKMRVSEKMYGLPGKCIACRTKIRIPRRQDLPEGVTEIHLKDHPELIRGPVKAPSAAEKAARKAMAKAGPAEDDGEPSTPNTELDLADSPPPAEAPPQPQPSKSRRSSKGSLAIDVLPMLQILCSLDYKFSRQLESLQLNNHDDEVLLAELEGHLTRVRGLRAHLDDQLHQRLMEAAIELTNTQEKLAQARLAARVGETNWSEYQQNVQRLRARRERLERRQQNLRGWLAAHDPHIAGGLLDLSIDNIPEEGFTVSLPSESEDEAPLLVELVQGLRSALEQRMHVRQRAAEVQKMSEKDASREIEDLRKETEQQRLVARARVAFFHDRLNQLRKDYASDAETGNAMLTGARDKLRMNAIARPEYDAVEKEIVRAKKDIARAQSVVERALGANAAEDVPAPHGTFLQRMALGRNRGSGPDTIVAYASAAALAVSILIWSLGGNMSLLSAARQFGRDGGAALLVLVPLALALAAAGITLSSARATRGFLYSITWFAGVVIAAYVIHEANYSLSSVAARFRLGDVWYLRPGMVLMLGGLFGILGAAVTALWPLNKLRAVPFGVAALGGVIAALIGSDALGLFKPAISAQVTVSNDNSGAGVVRVSNDGARTIRLLDRRPDARGTYFFLIERRVGSSSWSEAHGSGALWENAAQDNGVLYTLPPQGVQEVGFVLPPGDYRVVLDAHAPDAGINKPFTIVGPPAEPQNAAPAVPNAPVFAPQAEPAPAAAAPTETLSPNDESGEPDDDSAAATAADETLAAEDETTMDDAAPANPDGVPSAELTGVAASEAGEPRFSVRMHYADGTEERLQLPLGGKVWGEWAVTEYNPDEATVTIQSPEGLLILRRRVLVPITVAQ